jgi:hypothetical protein
MSEFELIEQRQGLLGWASFVASGLGSRGGPNKASNKWRSSPHSYLADSLEHRLATALRSRGGPNKVTNKLKRRLVSYLYN